MVYSNEQTENEVMKALFTEPKAGLMQVLDSSDIRAWWYGEMVMIPQPKSQRQRILQSQSCTSDTRQESAPGKYKGSQKPWLCVFVLMFCGSFPLLLPLMKSKVERKSVCCNLSKTSPFGKDQDRTEKKQKHQRRKQRTTICISHMVYLVDLHLLD